MNIFLFFAVLFFLIYLVGRVFERLKIPWIFSALLVGAVLSIKNPFSIITNSEVFNFLSNLGMYFLLFMIGFEINIKEIIKKTSFIFRATFLILTLETIFGGLLIHFLLNYSWMISFIVALSFATVGEAILIPILDKFKIMNKKLGQFIIGIGTSDDILEVILLTLVGFLVGIKSMNSEYFSLIIVFISIFILFILTAGFIIMKKRRDSFSIHEIDSLFLIVIALLFLFLGIGFIGDIVPLASLLAGISVRNFIPKNRLLFIDREIKAISYGFFAPFFFLWVGLSFNMKYLLTNPLIILIIFLVTFLTKIVGGYIVGKNELGKRDSLLLGIALSSRFSTSLIITKILLDKSIIGNDLYSIIIGSSILFTFIIPPLFSTLLARKK